MSTIDYSEYALNIRWSTDLREHILKAGEEEQGQVRGGYRIQRRRGSKSYYVIFCVQNILLDTSSSVPNRYNNP